MIHDSRIQCYIKKIAIHHYFACKAKIVIASANFPVYLVAHDRQQPDYLRFVNIQKN